MFKRIILSLASFGLTCANAYAGAWVQPEGHGLFIAQATYFTSDKFFDADGERTAQPRFTKYELQPYVEYGVAPNLTIGATAGLQRDTQSDIENYGVADPEIFLRTVIWKDARHLVSLQPLIKFSSEFEREAPPRGGTSSTDAELSVLYGRNLNLLSNHDYLDLRVGYRYRGTALNDQVRADASMGLEFAPNWLLIPAIRTVTSTGINDNVTFTENGDQDYNLVKLELGALYKVTDGQALGLTVFNHVSGAQTGNGVGVMLGFSHQF